MKDIARDLAKDRAVLAAHQESQQTTADQQHQSQHSAAASADTQATEAPPTGSEPTTINPETIPPPPQQPEKPSNTMESSTHTLQTFNPQASTKAEVQLQQEHIQYVDNECCQVAVGVVTSQGQPGSSQQTQDHVTSQQAAQQQAQQQAAAAAAATLPRLMQAQFSQTTVNLKFENCMAQISYLLILNQKLVLKCVEVIFGLIVSVFATLA